MQADVISWGVKDIEGRDAQDVDLGDVEVHDVLQVVQLFLRERLVERKDDFNVVASFQASS